jgi:hypothetical protein
MPFHDFQKKKKKEKKKEENSVVSSDTVPLSSSPGRAAREE